LDSLSILGLLFAKKKEKEKKKEKRKKKDRLDYLSKGQNL
jgi:hypothetical protein